MKRLFLLLSLTCIAAPALIAMQEGYYPDEVLWIEAMGAAYYNNCIADMGELIRQKPDFVTSERIDIFHRLLASSQLLSHTRYLALLLNHGAPIVTNTSEKNRTAEHELLTKIIGLAKNPPQFKTAEEESRMVASTKTVGIALLQVKKLRVQKEEEEFYKLFGIQPAVATKEASNEARKQMLQSDLQRMQAQAMQSKTH